MKLKIGDRITLGNGHSCGIAIKYFCGSCDHFSEGATITAFQGESVNFTSLDNRLSKCSCPISNVKLMKTNWKERIER